MLAINRRQQRRQYLRRKAIALGKQFAGHLMFSITTMIAVCSLMMMGLLLCSMLVFGSAIASWPFMVGLLGSMLVSVAAGFRLDRLIQDSELEEARIPYVDAIRPHDLPLAEVLLRTSDRPSHGWDEMLLMASSGVDSNQTADLLRSIYSGSPRTTSAESYQPVRQNDLHK